MCECYVKRLTCFACLSLVIHTRMLTRITPKTIPSNTTTATDTPAENPDSTVGDGVGGVALAAISVTSTGCVLILEKQDERPAHSGC